VDKGQRLAKQDTYYYTKPCWTEANYRGTFSKCSVFNISGKVKKSSCPDEDAGQCYLEVEIQTASGDSLTVYVADHQCGASGSYLGDPSDSC
jgi:hypothetical protein